MEFSTVKDIEEYFIDEMTAIKYLADIRWNKGWAKCAYCGNEKCYIIENNERYKCANPSCKKRFRVTVKTIFEASNIPLKKWYGVIFMFIKSRGRCLSTEVVEYLDITDKTEFYIREKLKFIWNEVDFIGKSNAEIFDGFLKKSCELYLKFQEVLHSPYYSNPLHIKDEDIDDISNVKQYNILERYTRYYINVYANWIWLNFAEPVEILSETFIWMKDNNIKEYNGTSMIKMIQQTVNRMWYKFIKDNPKYFKNFAGKNKLVKENIRNNLGNSYVAALIKSNSKYSHLTTKEIRANLELMTKKKEEIKERRKKNGNINTDFISHFS